VSTTKFPCQNSNVFYDLSLPPKFSLPAWISFPDACQKEFRRRITEKVEKKGIELHNPKRLEKRCVTPQRRIFVYSSNSSMSQLDNKKTLK
jgi:hypothetical protein